MTEEIPQKGTTPGQEGSQKPETTAEVPLRQPPLIRNVISLVGATIAIACILNILFILLAESSRGEMKPYAGILAWMVLPAIMIGGLVLMFGGMLLERKRRSRMAPGVIAEYPRLDLNSARHRRILGFSALGLALFIGISMVGSYHAYEYTETDAFCGTLCHSVMHPEYSAYLASPHARVGCVQCHVGPGATWYVKSKLSGAYQLYATALNKYPKPIPTPVENLRPAQQTCEQCHWPQKFFGAQLKVFNHYGYDEANTPRETQMLIKVGGGDPRTGASTGIHWHMNIANEITYVAADRQRQQIPYVRMRDRNTGRTTEYFAKDSKLTPQQIAAAPKRVMDCVDCHNRPTHIYVPPDRSVDRAMLAGLIDPKLPFIKAEAVKALTAAYTSTPQAEAAIEKALNGFYQSNHPDLYRNSKPTIDRAIQATRDIFKTTIFPEMKVDWRTHPDNVGHFYSQGCFRCHDDQHVSKDGKVISKDCNVCHTVVSQKEAGTPMIESPENPFVHPVDLGDMREFNCTDCHTGAAQE